VDPYASPHLEVRDGRVTVRPRRPARPPHARVRALMCSFNLNREGAPLSQFELTVRLKESGVVEPIVFCPEDGPLRNAYAGHGIDVHIGPHPLAGVFAEKEYAEAISSFAGFVRQRGVDLVYGNTVHTFYAIAAAEHLGLPSVWNPRESERMELHFAHFGPAITARARECFRHPYRVVFVAEATRQVYASLETTSNFTVVHNGLDRARLEAAAARWPREVARRSLAVEDGEIVLLVLGTVCERKGQVDLPLALGGLPKSWWPRLRCLIVGDRALPYSRRVHAAREALPDLLRDRVHVLPETDEPARYYRAADVFVCTSRVESFPRVTLEAMAHGLPLVTTPAFGITEQVREGVNALLYEPGDVDGLTAALTRLLEDEPLRHQMGAQARAVLECLNDFDTMASAYAEIFREAALSRGRTAAANA
jgi:O-antigen biosynthesis protein